MISCRQIRKMLAAGEIEPALELAEQVAAEKPNCAECQFLLAKSARRAGDFSKASAALQSARAANWPAQQIAFEQVLATAQSGQANLVEQELRRIFESDLQPAETEEVYEAIAYGHLAAFDTPEFLKCVDFWLEWCPQAVTPRQMKAVFYAKLGEHRNAADQFQSLVTDHPDFLPARKGLGDSLLALNLPTEAEKELRVCYERDPTAQNAVALAKCLVRTDRPDEARGLLEKFRDTEDRVTRAEILEELGRWLLDRNQVDEAFVCLQECIRIAPENFSAWHALSTAYSMTGEAEKASEALKRSQDSQRRVQRLFAVAGELTHAPLSTALRLEAAEIMFQQGLDQDAVAWLKTVLQIDANNPEANRRLAQYYLEAQDPEHAQNHSGPLTGLDPMIRITPGVLTPTMYRVDEVRIPIDEKVIGVVEGTVAKAYVCSAMSLTTTHVVNDLIGTRPISITYCDRTDCARVFSGTTPEVPPAMKLGGYSNNEMMLRFNDVMYYQSSKDVPLADRQFEKTTWGEWKAKYPSTLVYVGEREGVYLIERNKQSP